MVALMLWAQGWQPSGDTAIIGLRARDAWTSTSPLVGQPTTGNTYADVNSFHPGPIEYWLVGPFVHLLGPSLGLLVGAALVNGGSIAAAFWASFRRGGPVLLGLVSAGIALMVRSLGAASLADPFNSEIATYPLLAAVLLAWAAVDGDLTVLPAFVLTGSIAAQVHVSPAAAIALLVPAVMVGLVRVWRGQGLRSDQSRSVGWAAALGGILWLPVVVREISGPSNLSALARTAMTPHARMGPAFALDRLFSSQFPPAFVLSPERVTFVGGRPAAAVVLAAFIFAAAVGAATSLRTQRGIRGPSVLALVSGLLILSTMWTATNAPPFSALRADVGRATWVGSLLVVLTLFWAAWIWTPARDRRRWQGRLLTACWAVVGLALLASTASVRLERVRDGEVMSTVNELSDSVIAEVPPGPYRLDLQGEIAGLTVGPGLALNLEASGRPIRVEGGVFGSAYGSSRTRPGGPSATLRVEAGDSPQPVEGESLIAQAPLVDAGPSHVYVYLRP